MYKIKEVATMFQINQNALRFYESKDLIHPQRDDNDYRLYSIEDISRIQTILLYRKMGFSLEVITALLERKSNSTLLDLFATQYNTMNQHIHAMLTVRDSLEKCIESLLDKDEVTDSMIACMEQSAGAIAKMKDWKDLWDFDNWAEQYDEDVKKDNHGQGLAFYLHYDEVIKKTVQKVNEKPGKVVEIGIGTGNLMKNILEEKKISIQDAIGIDQSLNMLKKVKSKLPELKVKIGTFLQLPLEDNVYDTVVSSYAFHHCDVDEKRLAIKEMDRILKAHGRIIITDLMFENRSQRDLFEKSCTETELEELQDEYFGNVDEVESDMKQFGYECQHIQIDDLIWIVTGEK